MNKSIIREFVLTACLSLGMLHHSATANDSGPAPKSPDGKWALTAPTGMAPLVGVAVVAPKDVAARDSQAWSLRLSVPKVRWEIVGQERPKTEWTKVKAEVEVVTLDIAMHYSKASQLSEEAQDRVVDLKGKKLNREEVMSRLASDTPVLVSVSGEMPDPFYLRCIQPETLVILFGLPSAREYSLLPTSRRETKEAEQ